MPAAQVRLSGDARPIRAIPARPASRQPSISPDRTMSPRPRQSIRSPNASTRRASRPSATATRSCFRSGSRRSIPKSRSLCAEAGLRRLRQDLHPCPRADEPDPADHANAGDRAARRRPETGSTDFSTAIPPPVSPRLRRQRPRAAIRNGGCRSGAARRATCSWSRRPAFISTCSGSGEKQLPADADAASRQEDPARGAAARDDFRPRPGGIRRHPAATKLNRISPKNVPTGFHQLSSLRRRPA